MTKLSRRVFLGSAPAAAAAAGVFGTLFSSAAEAAINWDDTYNVIVIGAGGAGLSAAVSAKEAGCKKVVVLESSRGSVCSPLSHHLSMPFGTWRFQLTPAWFHRVSRRAFSRSYQPSFHKF